MTNLAGIHDREGQAIAPADTWVLDTVALSENPQQRVYDPAFNWITRLNWGYGSTGTLPTLDQYGNFALSAAMYVLDSKGCSRWVIGNEPSLSREWPNGQPIHPWLYADCYKLCRVAIHAVPGHERDEVLIAAPGPWNNELKYEGNPNGDWIQNFADVIKACGNEVDGFALHTYTHGYNVALVTSSARMQAPFQHRHYEFRTYRDYMEAIPDSLSHLPVYITEANGNGPWQAVGLMPAMLGEIDAWNKAGGQPIKAVIFYRYPKYDDFHIEGRADVIAEYKAACERGYESPQPTAQGQLPKETHLPTVSTAKIDPRLTDRGVKVHEVQSSDPNQLVWKIVKAQFFNQNDSQGRHHIYVESLDESGNPVNGIPFLVQSQGSPQQELNTNGRIFFDATNVPMWASEGKNGYSIKFWEGDTITGLGMGEDTPGGFNAGVHTSTVVTAQQRKAGGTAAPTPQPPTPPVTPAKPPYVPTPSEVFATPKRGIVSATKLNVRSGPGTDYPVVSQLAQGYSVTAIAMAGQLLSKWLQIGKGEWVYEKYVMLDEDMPEQPAPVAGDNWSRSRAFVKGWEGGFQDADWDAGNWTGCEQGKGIKKGTNFGISACAYPDLDIRNITIEQADAIYFRDYWQRSGADKLPWPMCLLVFDSAVNFHPDTAKKWLAESGGNMLHFVALRLRGYRKSKSWPQAHDAWVDRVIDVALEASKP